jgi:hypothetical protein
MAEKVLTVDEIKRIAPRYRGKPENFKLERVGKPRQPPEQTPIKEKRGPKSDVPVRGAHADDEQHPTPKRNDLIISEAIFGVDVHVPIHPRNNFTTNLGKLYHAYQPDEKNLERQMIAEDLAYYSTGFI